MKSNRSNLVLAVLACLVSTFALAMSSGCSQLTGGNQPTQETLQSYQGIVHDVAKAGATVALKKSTPAQAKAVAKVTAIIDEGLSGRLDISTQDLNALVELAFVKAGFDAQGIGAAAEPIVVAAVSIASNYAEKLVNDKVVNIDAKYSTLLILVKEANSAVHDAAVAYGG